MHARIVISSGLLVICTILVIAWAQTPSGEQVAEIQSTTTLPGTTASTNVSAATATATNTPAPTFTPSPTATPALEQSLRRNPPVPLRDEPIDADTVSRVGPLQTWTRGRFLDAAYSPDGTLLAIGSASQIYLQDAETLADVGYIATERPIEALAFSADSQIIATASLSETIALWSVTDSTFLRTLEGHTAPVTSIATDLNSDLLASGSEDGTVIIWNMIDGSILYTLEGHSGEIDSLVFSPDGSALVSASRDNTFRFWNTNDGQPGASLQWEERELQPAMLHDSEDALSIAAFSPDGQMLALAHQDSITLWDVASEQVRQTIMVPGPWARIYSLAFDPMGETIAAGYLSSSGSEASVRLNHLRVDRSKVTRWNVSDGVFIDTIKEAQGVIPIGSLSFHPDGTNVVAVSEARATVYDTAEGQPRDELLALNLFGSPVFSPGGDMVATIHGQLGKHVALWRIKDGELLHILQLPPEYANPGGPENAVSENLNVLVFSPDGQYIAASITDPNWREGIVGIWSVADGQFLHALDSATREIAVSPDATLLATKEQGGVKLWSMANGQLLAELTYDNAEYRNAVNHLTFSPDGAFLAASASGGAWGAHGGSLHIWSALDGELVQSLEIAPSGLNGSVAFSPDGTVLAASGGFIPESGEEVLKLWSMPDGQLLHEINYRGVLGDIRFSPDEQQIAVEALNSEQGIYLYNVRSGEMMREFTSMTVIGYTLDGSLLITHDRGVINFRDISSGEVVHRIGDSTGTPILSPDGKLLVAAFDGLQFWGVTDQIVPSSETEASVADQPGDEDSANDSEEEGSAGADNGEPLSTPEQDFSAQALQNVLQPVDGVVGVVVYDIVSNQTLYTQNEDRVFSAASLIKLPIAFTAYALADRGELSLDESLTITAEDIVGGTGSIQYEPVGSTYTIRELCARMLYDSDNTAANVVLERIGGFERVNNLLTELGMTQTKAQRFLMDFEALQAGRDNLTSPADMARMLQLLAQNEIAGANELLAALTQTNDIQKIPALLPSDVVVSNKTGVLPAPNGVEHDAAVVTLPDGRQYILVLMTDELSNNQVAIAAMTEASQLVYEHFQGGEQDIE